MSKLPRGLRNNNPGNIRLAKVKWQGEVPGSDKSFCTFSSMAYGFRALMKLLQNYHKLHGCKTVADYIGRWAPPCENDTNSYVQRVCKELNMSATEMVDVKNAKVLCDFAQAICIVENGQRASVSDIEAGLKLLLT